MKKTKLCFTKQTTTPSAEWGIGADKGSLYVSNNLDEKKIVVICLKTPDTVNYMKIPYTFLKSDILICLGAAQEADT